MNWGWKIAVAYTLFALMVVGTVFFSFTKKVSLVEQDYYEKEVQYQDQIERIKNSQALGGDFRIAFEESARRVVIMSKGQEIAGGTVHFYRPSDSDKDVKLALALDEHGLQAIEVESLEKGLWVAKVDWVAAGKSFYRSIQFEL